MALLLLLVGLLALRGAAEGAEGQQQPQQQPAVDIQYGDAGMSALMRGILHATNEGDDKLATKLREKLDALRQAPVEEAGATPWVTECEASAVLAAELFVISDPAEAPAGLSGAMGYLDEFWKTDKGEDLPYPGDFDQFMHDDGFRILRVAYDQLPAGVRKWREEQFATNTMERKFIAVLDGVAFFPPGVMTFLLPLFATQDVMAGQDPCQDSLGDLVHYHQARKEADPDTIFSYRYNGRIQVGSRIKIQTTAEKRSREAGTVKSGKDEL